MIRSGQDRGSPGMQRGTTSVCAIHCREAAYLNTPLSEQDKETNRRKSSVRAKVEHPFLGLKRLWGFAKARYRGMTKNANRAFAMLALLNINSWGRPLTG